MFKTYFHCYRDWLSSSEGEGMMDIKGFEDLSNIDSVWDKSSPLAIGPGFCFTINLDGFSKNGGYLEDHPS